MKNLVLDCAVENNIDLFDNVFDWSILLGGLDEHESSNHLT